MYIIQPPELVVYEPMNDYSTKDAIIEVHGKIDAEGDVFVNGQQVLIDEDGVFTHQIILERGLNIISIEGSKHNSHVNTIHRRVLLEKDDYKRVGLAK
jgi:hypothetical protein